MAVGAPARVYYGEVGRRLGADVVVPEHFEVANAVGAATGVVALGPDYDNTVITTTHGGDIYALNDAASVRVKQFAPVS